MGRRIFSKVFLFHQKNYWLLKTQACPFLPKSKNFRLKARKKVTKFFLMKKTFTQNDYSGLIKSNFENQVLYFLPKNRKLISQSTKKFYEQNFFNFETMSFTENVPRKSGNFWPKIWILSWKQFFLKKTPEKDLPDKYNAISTPLTKNISTPIKKLEKLDFFILISPNTSFWTRRMKFWPVRRFFFTNFPKCFRSLSRSIKKSKHDFKLNNFFSKISPGHIHRMEFWFVEKVSQNVQKLLAQALKFFDENFFLSEKSYCKRSSGQV